MVMIRRRKMRIKVGINSFDSFILFLHILFFFFLFFFDRMFLHIQSLSLATSFSTSSKLLGYKHRKGCFSSNPTSVQYITNHSFISLLIVLSSACNYNRVHSLSTCIYILIKSYRKRKLSHSTTKPFPV